MKWFVAAAAIVLSLIALAITFGPAALKRWNWVRQDRSRRIK